MSLKPMLDPATLKPESSEDERRLHDRSRFLIDLFFDGSEATGVASTKDISLGGLYMNTNAVMPEGALLTLRLPFGDERVVVNAEVIYSNPGCGCGVRFLSLGEKNRRVIERWIESFSLHQLCVTE